MQADLTTPVAGAPLASITILAINLDIIGKTGVITTIQNGVMVAVPLSPAVALAACNAVQNGIVNHLGAVLGTPLKNVVP